MIEKEHTLKVFGYHPFESHFQNKENEPQISPEIRLSHAIINCANKNGYCFQPLTVHTFECNIAVIDITNRAWLYIQNLQVCISKMIKHKVQSLELGRSSLVARTNSGWIYVKWGFEEVFDRGLLTPLPISREASRLGRFEAYHIRTCKENRFLYFREQRSVDQGVIYQLHPLYISAHPMHIKICFNLKMKGVSIGKWHSLCWDHSGNLYSWGHSCLALGYDELPEKESHEPRRVSNLLGFVVSAYAAHSYSLALGADGKLYEWGKKKRLNQQDQLILRPQPFLFSNSHIHFVNLKGGKDRFGILSVQGSLYVWGTQTRSLFPKGTIFDANQSQDVFQPTLFPCGGNVIDYSVESSFVVVTLKKETDTSVSALQKNFWTNLKANIVDKIHPKLDVREARIECEQIIGDQCRNIGTRHCSSEQKALQMRNTKQEYFRRLQKKQDMMGWSPVARTFKQVSFKNQASGGFPAKQQLSFRMRPKKVVTEGSQRSERKHLACLFDEVINSSMKKAIGKLQRVGKMPTKDMRPNSQASKRDYNQKLQEVIKKKQRLEQQQMQENLSNLQFHSYEFKMQLKAEKEMQRNKKISKKFVQHSLGSHLVQHFLVKLLTSPLGEGRVAKIATFARHLKLERLQKNLRGLFARKRIAFKMQKLKEGSLIRLFTLQTVFHKYVVSFRQKKWKACRKLVVVELVRRNMRGKLRIGVSQVAFAMRKLQKFREWLVMVKQQRKRCLTRIWNTHLLKIMRPKVDCQSSLTGFSLKTVIDPTFDELYRERQVVQPELKLECFLNSYSIFKIKKDTFCRSITVCSFTSKRIKAPKCKVKMRTGHQEDRRQQLELLPYSLHSNQLIKPKWLDLAIPQMLKVSEKWMKIEQGILNGLMERFILEHERRFCLQLRQYQSDLAYFICKRYDTLCEKRWKYILEYNQMQPSSLKRKQETRLRRILGKVGAQNILLEDHFPQKQTMLEEAIKMNDAPVPPQPYLTFGKQEFGKFFKCFVDSVSRKAKELRKMERVP